VAINLNDILNGPLVTFIVDTNILIEFKSLEQIPWRELAPNADVIAIIVPTKVCEEMDAHKKKSGRLKRQGITFSKMLRRIEEAPNDKITVLEKGPKITLELGGLFRKSELDSDQFELEDSDGLIVAEMAAINKVHQDAVLLSDDAKPLRIARQAGLACTRPKEEWRREEGHDERDNEISKLKRELGAQPDLNLELLDRQSPPDNKKGKFGYYLETSPEDTSGDWKLYLVKAAMSVDKIVSREISVQKYGLDDSHSILQALGCDKLTSKQLVSYEEGYKEFRKIVESWAEKVPNLLNTKGMLLPINIRIKNVGDRVAERVKVKLNVSNGFTFAPFNLFDELYDHFLEPPDAPKPVNPYSLHSIIPNVADVNAEFFADEFYPRDEPLDDLSSNMVSWRCEELRHGTEHMLTILLHASEKTSGVLNVELSSATVAQRNETNVSLCAIGTPATIGMQEYILRRILLMPPKYQQAIKTNFCDKQ